MSEPAPGYPILKTQIRFEQDVVSARQKTRRLAELLHFQNQDQVRLATAVSELARNAFQYAEGGLVEFFIKLETPQTLYVRLTDHGPGLADLNSVMLGTYVSKTGMGVGISGTRKMMDYFDLQSTDRGTTVTIGKALPQTNPQVVPRDLPKLADMVVHRDGGSAFEEIQKQNHELLDALDELNKSQAELTELNRELAETNRGVVALYAELDEKAASLQRANEVKTSFLSNMTHEFRTPLSSVISLTRILLQGIDGELNEEQCKQVSYIRSSSESLLEMVNDLLDLAKVAAGKIKVHSAKFEMSELLGGLRGMFRPILSETKLELIIDGECEAITLVTDQAKVSQILRNLISNAIKFTERGEIRLKARVDDGIVFFSVHDTGIGIAAEDQVTIFEDFGQIQSKLQRPSQGTGLGLPLSRKLSRLLGGDLAVESTPGRGSVFTVQIPIVYRGGEDGVLITAGKEVFKSSPGPGKTPPSDRFNILLIDDDEASRYVLKGLIGAEITANFIEVNSAKLGLECIANSSLDAIFLDLNMPDFDGFDFLTELQTLPGTNRIPIIVNTARKISVPELTFLHERTTAVLSKERLDDVRAAAELHAALVAAGFDFKARDAKK